MKGRLRGARTLRILGLLGLTTLTILTTGCQTWGGRSPSRDELPADLAPIFSTCAPSEGGVSAKVFEAGGLKAAAELDWLAKAVTTLDLELTGPIGQTLLALHRDEANLTLAGPLAAKIPPARILRNGFLEIDGHFVGLRANEVPCLFRAALPNAWLQHLDSVESDARETRVVFAEKQREIRLSVAKSEAGFEGYCVEVAWSTFFFFKRSFSWCNEDVREARRGVLSGLGDFTLEWTRIDDQAE